jgi:hypothetical protein
METTMKQDNKHTEDKVFLTFSRTTGYQFGDDESCLAEGCLLSEDDFLSRTGIWAADGRTLGAYVSLDVAYTIHEMSGINTSGDDLPVELEYYIKGREAEKERAYRRMLNEQIADGKIFLTYSNAAGFRAGESELCLPENGVLDEGEFLVKTGIWSNGYCTCGDDEYIGAYVSYPTYRTIKWMSGIDDEGIVLPAALSYYLSKDQD